MTNYDLEIKKSRNIIKENTEHNRANKQFRSNREITIFK